MLKLGTQNISGLYVGEQKIKKAFVGAELVFEDTPAYTVCFYAIEGTDTGKILNSSAWTVAPGESVTVNPWTIDGYVFEGWYEDDVLISTDKTFVYTPVKKSTTIYLRYHVVYRLYFSLSGGPDSAVVYINDKPYTLASKETETQLYFAPGELLKIEYKDIPTGYAFKQWYFSWSGASGSPTATSNPYTFTMPNNDVFGILYVKEASRLPAGYTEVEYIEASDTSSCITNIDLRITTSSILTIDCYVPEISTSSLSSRSLHIGAYYYVSGSTYRAISIFSSGKALQVQTINGAGSTAATTSIYANAPIGRYTFTYDYSAKKASFNEKSATVAQVYGTAYPYFRLGATSSTATNCTNGLRIYSVKVTYTGTSTDAGYRTDLVPCKNPSGTVGLYDLTGGKFYGPASTSHPWIAGPVV